MNASLLLVSVFIWCALIAISDWRSRRIPNSLVAAGLVAAVAGLVLQGQTPFGATPLQSALGFGIGLLAFLPLYARNIMAAGDVKLFAAIGALFGMAGLIPVWLIASVLAGAHALLWPGIRAFAPPETMSPNAGVFERLPFGLHLAVGIVCVVLQPPWVVRLGALWPW